MSTLHQRVTTLLGGRGKTPVWHDTPTIRDDSDGHPIYIESWDVARLGAAPTTGDGFTEAELRGISP